MQAISSQAPAQAAAQHGPTSPLGMGLSLLAAERDGISALHDLYSSDELARKCFEAATDALVETTIQKGSIIVSGVGKSGLIGKKIVATLNSLGLRSFWLHPTEALHGDLGMIGPHDTLILITFSGSTAELLSLACHLPPSSPLILMSSAKPDEGYPNSSLPLFAARIDAPHDSNILLPTPIPVTEKSLFGISAPTVSTTVTLALGDALAMSAAHKLHEDREGVKAIFHKYHPGGAIGRAAVIEHHEPGSISPSDTPMDSPQTQSLEGSTLGDGSESAPEDGWKLSIGSKAAREGLPKAHFETPDSGRYLRLTDV